MQRKVHKSPTWFLNATSTLLGRAKRNNPASSSVSLHVYNINTHYNVPSACPKVRQPLQREQHHWSERSALPQFGLSCLFSPAEALSRSLFRVKLGWPDPIQTWARQWTTVPAGTTGCCLPCVIWKLGQKGCCSGGKKRKDLSRSTPAGDKQAPTLLECYITHMNGHPVWCTNN